ncbi:hypothetical protein [Streptomyces sp. NBC_00503]|uniref:hypothetical protein n=1 Tax=Streptomyces sp. NBC_00503 TaxID=2903659 RepID=UPI002E7FDAC4|nr:hypothetical protein [Streptomyces sp. NBC_00503]WUD83207.1 hypothetical protein OG490_23070 [Streptomyces sp. NBC_00503]
MGSVIFVDETTAGGRGDGWGMEITEERLALRELIRRRIFQEVAEAKAARSRPAAAPAAAGSRLVRPAEADGPVDPQAQTEAALAAFGRNGFLVLVGERQITDLDEEIDLPLGTEVTFLKLVALVGG